MRAVLLWGLLPLLPLLWHLPSGARGHSLGRLATDVEQLKSVLQRLEASLTTGLSTSPEHNQEAEDYAPDPGPRSEGVETDEPSLKGLLDLLKSSRRSSSCFGARMDRIGNASGLGCGRG